MSEFELLPPTLGCFDIIFRNMLIYFLIQNQTANTGTYHRAIKTWVYYLSVILKGLHGIILPVTAYAPAGV